MIILTAPDLNIESESILIILGKRDINGGNIFWEGFVFKENYWVSIGQHQIGTLQKDF
jgi:hypothetical protein